MIIEDEAKYRNIYLVRVRPPVFSLKMDVIQNKFVDDKGYEYKCIELYIISEKQLILQPSTLIHIEGIPLPSPKTQKTTLLAYNISFPEDINSFDTTKIDQLKQEFEGKPVSYRLNWILDRFTAYSRIIGRRNVATAGFLIYFTPLYAEFRGEIRNGWGNGAVIGDTTTGKSETIKKIAAKLKAGMIISAESASIVGLTGAAIQTEKGAWFIDWGFLPLNDRKLIGLDGMHKLSKAAIATMAEAERDGRITIVKAGKATTTARTRQIKIFNPLDEESKNFSTKSLSEFLYPCQALKTVLDEISIARLDLAVTSDSRDVTPEEINSVNIPEQDLKLDLLSEALKWIWSNTAKIEWTEQAETTLLTKATELEKKFYFREVPLISPDTKWKLARLSIALAGLTISTTDYKTIQVTEDHVNTIVDFLSTEYTRMGLNILAQLERYEKLTIEDVETIIKRVSDQTSKHPIENIPEILKFIAIKTHVTKDEIMVKFDLKETNQARPLLATLQNEGLLTNKKGFYSTAKLNEACTVTKNFTLLTTFNMVETKPPLKEKSKEEQEIKQTKLQIEERGGFNSDSGKAGKCGKTLTTPTPENKTYGPCKVTDADREKGETEKSALREGKVVHYQDVNAYVESHKCDNKECKNQNGLLAEKKQFISKEDQERLKLETNAVYLCNDCFEAVRAKAESEGAEFVKDSQEQPTEGF